MTTAAHQRLPDGVVVDVVHRPGPGWARPLSWLTPAEKAQELQRIQAERAVPASRELGFAALERRIRAVLLELDPRTADENRTMANRTMAEAGADVRT